MSWVIGSTTLTTNITTADQTVLFDDRDVLKTLTLTPPLQSDIDFNMTVTLTTPGSYQNNISTFTHPIKVLAVADQPQVTVDAEMEVLETATIPLYVAVVRSDDQDNSESLIIKFALNQSQGILEAINTEVVTFTHDTTTGVYTLIATGGDPASRQALLNAHFTSFYVTFRPTYGFGGQANVTVEVISVELADGDDLAAAIDTDPDRKRESVSTL